MAQFIISVIDGLLQLQLSSHSLSIYMLILCYKMSLCGVFFHQERKIHWCME